MVIEARTVTPQVAPMAQTPNELIPHELLAEMRPERIGYRMKLLRIALGKKPSEMADTLGIERTYWSRFEGGKRPLTESFGALLVDRFGVTLDFLLLGRWDKLPLDLAERMREAERAVKSGPSADLTDSGTK